jgi:predicted transcriptional regulator
MNKLRLTRKQHYSKICVLRKSGLVQKQNGKCFLTSFGVVHKTVCEARQLIALAVKALSTAPGVEVRRKMDHALGLWE